jgi:hypothetical protein
MLIQQYITTTGSSLNTPKKLGPNGTILSGDDIILERGGPFRSYSCDLHMNSLSHVWNPSSLTQNLKGYEPGISSFQLSDSATAPIHLIVLQHGFQGTGFDMRLIRNALHVEFPHYLVQLFPLCSDI